MRTISQAPRSGVVVSVVRFDCGDDEYHSFFRHHHLLACRWRVELHEYAGDVALGVSVLKQGWAVTLMGAAMRSRRVVLRHHDQFCAAGPVEATDA